jgi:hypothetical protein
MFRVLLHVLRVMLQPLGLLRVMLQPLRLARATQHLTSLSS